MDRAEIPLVAVKGASDLKRVLRKNTEAEVVLLEASQPYANHNGGTIEFSPVDGYLYIGLGDD